MNVFDNVGVDPVDWVRIERVQRGNLMYRGYPEQALITNRSSLLLFGGSEAERRAWADEAAANF
ncbi:MAG TPA: hypothetical protein VE618_02265, partial [Myxococcaceae bacterium]|nr:hypothetical protein [Myxococcaceae bacterium]